MLACIDIHYFLLSVAIRYQLPERHPYVILVDGEAKSQLVIACSPKALKIGVRVGMSVKEARAMSPESTTLLQQSEITDAVSARVLEALTAFSPSLEIVAPGVVIGDLGRVTDRIQLEDEAKKIIEAIFAKVELFPTVGIAESRFVACVAAEDACAAIKELTGVERKETQVRKFLHRIGMRPRKVGGVPGKADREKQEE